MDIQDKILKWSSLSIDPEFDESFGCLHVFLESKSSNGHKHIRERLISIYGQVNLSSFAWKEYLKRNRSEDPLKDFEVMCKIFPLENDMLRLNLSEKLQPDEIVVYPESTEGWYAIGSRQYEWTLPGLNPLAVELSKKFTVLSTTHIVSQYDELTLYKNGKAHSMHLNGLSKENLKPEVTAVDFEWDWFVNKGSVVTGEELKNSLDLVELMNLAGPDATGFRNFVMDNPMTECDPEYLISFRLES